VEDQDKASEPKKRAVWASLLPWLITLLCFAYLWRAIASAAARSGMTTLGYLAGVFQEVDWGIWLALMIPYSVLFFLIDTLVVWRAIGWFNTRVSFSDMLPIRGSSYILSIINEQVGKGAMGLYLNRRHGVPGWEVGSTMLFLMVCEFYSLLSWAVIGWGVAGAGLPEVFASIPVLAATAWALLFVFIWFASSELDFGAKLRSRPLFRAFRAAKLTHYLAVIALRSPAMISAVVVYTLALRLFGVEIGFGEMLGYLPVIFFGAATPGPMRTVAITLWVVLFPGHAGEMTAFGFVQHNFFVFFNAVIGLIFLKRAKRELFA